MPDVRPFALAAALTLALAGPVLAAPTIGQPAPAFTIKDGAGKTRSLAEFKGKTVVLEWTNAGCPYVQKHYESGNMQGLQKAATQDGVVWLTLISSAPGKQGYVSPAEAKTWKTTTSAGSTAVLLDPAGQVGRTYEAKVTPHMYVVNGAGTLVYMGGIDDKPTADPASLKGATNYVAAALSDLKARRQVTKAVSRPYGCTIKYGS